MTSYYHSQNLCIFIQLKLMHELLLVVGRKVNYFYAIRLTDDDDDDDNNNNIFSARCN